MIFLAPYVEIKIFLPISIWGEGWYQRLFEFVNNSNKNVI